MIFILLNIFLLILNGSLKHSNHISSNVLSTLEEKDTLLINYYGGDEAIIFYQIEITANKGKLFAERKQDKLYTGGSIEKNFKKELNKKERNIINQFINKVQSFKYCGSYSSFMENYTIMISNDTIGFIKGNCDWGVGYYFDFEKQIFKSEFRKLDLKRRQLVKNLNRQIQGIWYPNRQVETLESNELLVLTKSYSNNSILPKNCIWNFSPPNKFVSVCNEMDLNHSKRYNWDVDQARIYLDINGGVTTDEQGYMVVANYGASFKLVKMSQDTIQLQFLWRN